MGVVGCRDRHRRMADRFPLFGLYASNVGNYDQTYGSLVVALGAELNAELEAQTARDTTVGPERPRGDRDATAADTLASEPSRQTE